MQDIRIHFRPSAGKGQLVSLTDGNGQPIGVALPFTLSLDDDDYANLSWYLEAIACAQAGLNRQPTGPAEAEALEIGRAHV